jgi:hypothetical protein
VSQSLLAHGPVKPEPLMKITEHYENSPFDPKQLEEYSKAMPAGTRIPKSFKLT